MPSSSLGKPDRNYESHADVDGVIIENRSIPLEEDIEELGTPLLHSDSLKLSKATEVTVKSCSITGGSEDCIDMNRYCSDILISDCILKPRGKYGITIKGGTSQVRLKNVLFTAHGKETDIDLGNWSDQSAELVTDVVLDNITSLDGKPVKVRVLWAQKPKVIGGNVKLTVYPKLLVKIYRYLRARNLAP